VGGGKSVGLNPNSWFFLDIHTSHTCGFYIFSAKRANTCPNAKTRACDSPAHTRLLAVSNPSDGALKPRTLIQGGGLNPSSYVGFTRVYMLKGGGLHVLCEEGDHMPQCVVDRILGGSVPYIPP